jgi:hypothetical protein
MGHRNRTAILKFLGVGLLTLLVLMLISAGLPALLLSFQVPSFQIGIGDWWIARWQNDTQGSGISFNILVFMAIAVVVGLIGAMRANRKHGLED